MAAADTLAFWYSKIHRRHEVVTAILFAMLSIAVSQDEEKSLMSVKGSC